MSDFLCRSQVEKISIMSCEQFISCDCEHIVEGSAKCEKCALTIESFRTAVSLCREYAFEEDEPDESSMKAMRRKILSDITGISVFNTETDQVITKQEEK